MNRVRDFFRELFLLPVIGGLTTVFGVLSGYLGSHYDHRIGAATYPAFLPGAGAMDVAVTVFWGVVFLFAACFTATAWAQKVSDDTVNGEFKESLRALFTMPAKGFLQRYQKISLASTNFIWALPPSLPLPKLEHAIRVQLGSICNVVKEYDGAGGTASYGCNVMLYVAAGTPKFLADAVALQKRLRCIETGVAVTNLAGVLDLKLDLSISSTTNFNPDSHLKPLALPIPHVAPSPAGGKQDFSKVVPGAPHAFVSGKELVFGNQKELIDEVDRNRGFSSTVLAELTDILGAQAAHVQSLICIPLFAAPQGTTPPAPIGVLNIHRSVTDPHAAAKFEYLSPLLTQLVQNLGNLIEQLP